MWPITDQGYHNAQTKYWEASADEMLLNAEQRAVIQKILYAGYPYDSVGALAPLYENWGVSSATDDLAADLTQAIIWDFVAQWSIPGNTHTVVGQAGEAEVDGWKEAHDLLVDFALHGSLPAVPSGFTPKVTGSETFTESDGYWKTGALSITNPDGFKLMYNVELPDGVTLLDEDDNEIYANWDFVNGEFIETGYTLYGGDTFYLQTEDEQAVAGKKISFKGSLKIPTDVRQYNTNDIGKGDKNDGQGSVMHPFQTMMSVGVDSRSYQGDFTLSAPVQKITIPVSKIWDDDDNADNARPGDVIVELWADGVNTNKVIALSPQNNWKGSFEGVDRLNAQGQAIKYSVKEQSQPTGYQLGSIAGDETGFVITNVETTSIAVTKDWNDSGNESGRPASVKILLTSDEQAIKPITAQLESSNDWKYTFTGLPKYHNGKEVKYEIAEAIPSDSNYHAHIDAVNHKITNHYDEEKTSIVVEKVWNDAYDQDGVRPSFVNVQLQQRVAGTENDFQDVDGSVITLRDSTEWEGEFDNLSIYTDDSHTAKWEYTVVEVAGPTASPYTSAVEKVTVDGVDTNVFRITNTYKPLTTDVTVTKKWVDDGNKDGGRPDEVTVKLFANGVHVGTQVVPANADASGDTWTYTFTDLPKNEAGVAINYTVTEELVHGYTASYSEDTLTITNTHTHAPEMVEISGVKEWADHDNAHGDRPDSITLKLENRHGEIVGTATVKPDSDGKWSYSFGELPAYEHGEKAVYFVIEDPVEFYTTVYNRENHDVLNEYDYSTVAVEVQKAWDDNSDADGIRPKSVTVELLANGEKTGVKAELRETNDWKVEFAELAPHEDHVAIAYSVVEVDVPAGYVSKVSGDAGEGFVITNTRDKSKDDPDKPLDPVEPIDPNSSNGSSDASISSQTGDTASNAVPGLIALVVASAATLVFARRRMLKS